MQDLYVTAPRRILVVEDNRDLREVIRLQLQFAGFEVELVADAEAALVRMAESVPEAMIVDVALPGLDGTALCQRLRRNRKLPVVPILVYTAIAGTDPRIQAALELPAVRYQSKGGSTRILQSALEKLLRAPAA